MPNRHRVVIIGSGFAGIAMAIALKRKGIEDFVILERAGDVGGTWRDNSYPGAACDVVSRLYSYSFAPDYPWSDPFAPRAEIFDYIKSCVAAHGLMPHVRLNAEVEGAAFDARTARWTVAVADGETFEAAVLVSAVGLFKTPNIPDLPGLDSFAGAKFHSARWDHGFDLAGKRVAVIGNGASAVQFVPRIADTVAKLHLFMRTPQYVMPKGVFPGTRPIDRWLGARPWLRSLARFRTFLLFEKGILWRKLFPAQRLKGEAAYRALLEAKVGDPDLRRKLTPTYPVGCKRMLGSDQWLDTLVKPQVEVVDTAIARVTADAVVTGDGVARPVDAIIFATGFRTTEHLAPMRITGLDGRELAQEWRRGAEAYLGIAVSGFPNFFMLYGPNTNAGISIIFMLECQAHYIARCVARLGGRPRYMNLRAERQRRYNERIQARLATTVPAQANCLTYFKNAYGRITTQWPGFSTEYRWRTRRVRGADYDMVEAAAP